MIKVLWDTPDISLYSNQATGVLSVEKHSETVTRLEFVAAADICTDGFSLKLSLKQEDYASIPENAEVAPKASVPRPYLNETLGGMAENYGHEGTDARSGQSGFHWGSGSSLVSAAEFLHRYGDRVEFTPLGAL